MDQRYTYFTIPYHQVPEDPAYTTWFATWSTQPPSVVPGTPPPFVVGATKGALPASATVLGLGIKDPPPPPPAPPTPDVSLTDYQKSVTQWLADGRALGEPFKYFTVPFDQLPVADTHTLWFSTWSKVRPPVPSGTHPPHVIGVTRGPLPAGAVSLASGIKDPPPPPPASPTPGAVSTADYQRSVSQWLTDGRSL